MLDQQLTTQRRAPKGADDRKDARDQALSTLDRSILCIQVVDILAMVRQPLPTY